MVSRCVCIVGYPSRRYPPLPSSSLSSCRTGPERCLMERWQWRPEGFRTEPPPYLLLGSWDLFQSPIALSAKNKCLTLFDFVWLQLPGTCSCYSLPCWITEPFSTHQFLPRKIFLQCSQVLSHFLSTLSSLSPSEEGIFSSLQIILVTSLCPFWGISATAEDMLELCPRCNVLVSGLPLIRQIIPLSSS